MNGRGLEKAMSTAQEIIDWQKRLEEMFSHNDIVGGRFLLQAMNEEDAAGEHFIKKYRGHRVLTDSFLEFFGETILTQIGFNNENGWPQDRPFYVTRLMMYATMFRVIRAGELLSTKGYPLSAYALLRGVKDQIWILCAAANGMATFGELFGWEGLGAQWSEDAYAKVVGNRVNTERKIRELIIGKKSELSVNTQSQLEKWERLFNTEAHRGLFSLFTSSRRLIETKGSDFRLGPMPSEMTDAMYVTHASELHWMALRLLPAIRRAETLANTDWTKKWDVLDGSFRFMLKGLSDMGKKIADAITELIDAKFKFNPTMHYQE
jgi:hypothetical protein